MSTVHYRGPMFYLLLLAIILIWGNVFLTVISSFNHIEDERSVPVSGVAPPSKTIHSIERDTVVFNTDTRNPFDPPAELYRGTVKQTKAASFRPRPATAHTPPPLDLVGIVDDTAILRGPHDLIIFARAGEAYFDMRITGIEREDVGALFEGKAITLSLPD